MGRLIVLLLFCAFANAQAEPVSSVSIGGVEYEFVGDNNAWFRVDDVWWKTVHTVGDLNGPILAENEDEITESYVRAVVREGIINGIDLNLSVGDFTRNILRVSPTSESVIVPDNSVTFVDPSFYPNPLVGGSSWDSSEPGFIITLNRDHWNRISYTAKVDLMFHELGHAIYGFGHVCHHTSIEGSSFKYRAFMSTGACSVAFNGPGYEEAPSPYDLATFDGTVAHYFGYTTPLGTITRKQSGKSAKGVSLPVPIHD